MGKVGRPGRPPRPHGGAARRDPRGRDEHLHDDQRHRGLAARPLRRPRRRTWASTRPGSPGTTQNDIVKEYLQPRAPTSSRPGRACASPSTPSPTRCATCPSGTRSTSAATTSRRRGPRRSRRWPTRWPPPSACSTPCAPRARSTPAELPAVVGRISFFVNSGVRFVEETCKMRAFTADVGPHLPRALRRGGPQAAPLPLRRAGQLARADRAAAGEQRAAHRARDARRHPLEERPGPGHAAAGLERGARPAPALGPAVVAAHPAGPGLRVRPARVRRHLRGLAR